MGLNSNDSNIRSKRKRRLALILAPLGIIALLFAVSSTGAYFSDSHDGTIDGTIGSIEITPSGGAGPESMDFTFSNMLPGVPQTATLTYENTGNNPQDVWVTFPNLTALSSLNNLGTYGEVHVISNGTPVFESANLNDRASTCGPFSPSGCWPMPSKIKLADNVAPGGTGTFQFVFNYASKMTTPESTFNPFPVPDQQVVRPADGVGDGLPYQLVATQVGQQP